MSQIQTTSPICPDALSDDHIAQFHEFGYLAFEEVFTPDEVAAACAALSEITIGLLERAREGGADIKENPNATRNYAGRQVVDPNTGFGIHFEAGIDPLALPVEEAELKFRKLHGYHREHQTFVDLTRHPRVAGFISQLIGEEAILKAEMALSKPPFIGSEKPWHQDNAYFNWLPLEKVATAWLALDDATVENGCMHVLPGGHKLGALRHHHTIDCEIFPDRIDRNQALPVPLKAGGATVPISRRQHRGRVQGRVRAGLRRSRWHPRQLRIGARERLSAYGICRSFGNIPGDDAPRHVAPHAALPAQR